ncbi:MAG: XRE family transcriptional regulator [Lachnospiraceae bacterium]|nr:XRE family transcriptional regulator [Lachnospiraceae bacterium]
MNQTVNVNEMSFGQYIEAKRKGLENHPSLRATAMAIGVSPQFYSEVEKDKKGAFKQDRLDALASFLKLNDEESSLFYKKAAASRQRGDYAIPSDLPEYIVERSYVEQALRLAKELDAGEEEWLQFVKEMQKKREVK